MPGPNPLGQKSNLQIEALPNSRVRISIAGASEFEFESLGASYVSGRILEAAKESHALTGNPLPDFTKNPAVWAVLQPSAVGLAPSRLPNHESLTLQFGETIFAVPIERSQLRVLGQAMVALSAPDRGGH